MAKSREAEWIRTKEAATRLGISAQQVRNRIKDGKLKHRKVQDEDGTGWHYEVDTASFPPTPPAKIAQTLQLSEEKYNALVEGLSDEVVSRIEPLLSDLVAENRALAEKLAKCYVILEELKENTRETREVREGVEDHREEMEERSWWQKLGQIFSG